MGLTQLNLILLNNFYKQIYEGSHEASVDRLNCGSCSEAFPVSRMSAYLQHKALHLAGVLANTEKPLGSPTISGSDQTVPAHTDNKEPSSFTCAQSSKLTRHMKIHKKLGFGIFQCNICDMPFSVQATLDRHKRKCKL